MRLLRDISQPLAGAESVTNGGTSEVGRSAAGSVCTSDSSGILTIMKQSVLKLCVGIGSMWSEVESRERKISRVYLVIRKIDFLHLNKNSAGSQPYERLLHQHQILVSTQ